MTYEALGKLWEKGGVGLVMLVLMFLLLRFVAQRGVRAFDSMGKAFTASAKEIATAVTDSSNANVEALSGLTQRVSRIEAKVEVLGSLALHAAPSASPTDQASIREVFHGEDTGVGGIPEPIGAAATEAIPIAARRKTPAPGVPSLGYRAPSRPGTKGGV